ncbi:uncharacterized protein [Pseudorasbora parva]|uniref:uncharacterized protein isoform X2 n=1 Tax=Pseudorasbora parva TaxID=51549 RepID=UPI00351F0C68
MLYFFYYSLALPQANLTASASVILETDTVQLSCNNTEHLKMEMEMCVFYIYGRERNLKLSSSCQISLNGSQISIWSGGQNSSVRITCFYTVKKTQVQEQSPHSDPVTITIKLSTPDVDDTTAMKTDPYSKSNLSTSTTKETMSLFSVSMATSTLPVYSRMSMISEPSTWMPISTSTPNRTPRMVKRLFIIKLVSSGVGVILSGLICLWFACQKRRRCNKMRSIPSDVPSQGIDMCSGPAETYCLTSVLATSQPKSVGVLVNKQQKKANTEENEIVYHLYCTIPDKPDHSDAEDQVYSLVP